MNDIATNNGYIQCPYCGGYFLKSGMHCCKEMVEHLEKSPYSSSAFEALSKSIKDDFSRPDYPRSEPDPSVKARLFTIPSNEFDYSTADFIRKQEYIKNYVNGAWDSPYRCKRVLNGMYYAQPLDKAFIQREKMRMICDMFNSIQTVENIVIEFELSSAEDAVLTELMERYHETKDYINEHYKILTLKAKKHITCKNCEYYDGYDCERLGLQLIDSSNYCSWAKERTQAKK